MDINKENRTVTLTFAEYASLEEDSQLLRAAESAGVDNWCGWGEWDEPPQTAEEIIEGLEE